MMPMPAAKAADRAQYLTFSLSGGEYAIAVLSVREIIDRFKDEPLDFPA